jgi:hypothetical protein
MPAPSHGPWLELEQNRPSWLSSCTVLTQTAICEHAPSLTMVTTDTEGYSDGLSKNALLQLVRQQFDLWPHDEHKWAPKRDTTVKVLKQVLLVPKYGFRKAGRSMVDTIDPMSHRFPLVPRGDEADLPGAAEEGGHGLDTDRVQDLSGEKLSPTRSECSSEVARPSPAASGARSEVDGITVHSSGASASQKLREGSVKSREGSVRSREGSVRSREGSVMSREGSVRSREGSVNGEDFPPRDESALAATVSAALVPSSLQVCPIRL